MKASLTRLDRHNLNIIRKYLEGNNKNKLQSTAGWMKKVKNYYGQCKQRDKETIATTRTFVSDLIEDVSVNIKRDKKKLTETLASVFTHFGGDVFFKVHIGINDHNSSEHIIKIDQPSFTFPNREHYLVSNKSKAEQNFQYGVDYIRNIYKLLQSKTPQLLKIRQILQIESNLSCQPHPLDCCCDSFAASTG